MQIIVRVQEIKINLDFGKAGMTVQPIDDILYAIEVLDREITTNEDGSRVLSINGIRDIVKGCRTALIIEVNEDDF